MNLNLIGGTPQQRNLVEVAVGLCSYPLDQLTNVTVNVVWGDSFAPSDSFHPYMTTAAELDGNGIPTGTFITQIASWADDPNAPGNQGLLDPAAQIRGFYLESFVHEIGHVVSQLSFMSWVSGAIVGQSASYGGRVPEMCALFTTGSGDGARQGTAADFDNIIGPSKPWNALIKEAVAEWFHWGFYTGSPFIFTNRTIWTISEENWPQFNTLLEAGGLVTGLRWNVANLPDLSGEFDLDTPWEIGGGLVGKSVSADGEVQAFLQALQPEFSQEVPWLMIASANAVEVEASPPYAAIDVGGELYHSQGKFGPIGGGQPPPFLVSQNFVQDVNGNGELGWGALEPSEIGSALTIELDASLGDSDFSFLTSLTSTWTLLATGDSISFAYATGMNNPVEFDLVRSYFISGSIAGRSFTNGGTLTHDHSVTRTSDAISMAVSLITTTIPVSTPYPHVIPLIIGTAVPGPAATGLQLVEGD